MPNPLLQQMYGALEREDGMHRYGGGHLSFDGLHASGVFVKPIAGYKYGVPVGQPPPVCMCVCLHTQAYTLTATTAAAAAA